MDAYDTILIKRFREAVEQQIGREEKIIASGTCETFEDYRAKCGEAKGLRSALTLLDEVCLIANKEGP